MINTSIIYPSSAQQLVVKNTRFIGGNSIESAADAIVDKRDNSLVFLGTTYSCSNGDIPACSTNQGRSNLAVGKVDSNGNLAWVKLFGGSHDDEAARIIPTSDGGYAVLASTMSNDGDVTGNHYGLGPNRDLWLLRLSNTGGLLWKTCYGSDYDEFGLSVTQTTDGGFAMVGRSNGFGGDVPFRYVNSEFTYDWFVIKTDSQGNKSWAKTVGGTGYEEDVQIIEALSGYFLVGGTTSHDHECNDSSWHPGVNTQGDCVVIRLDSSGNFLWNKTYGGSGGEGAQDAIWEQSDSSIVFVGPTFSNDYSIPSPSISPHQQIWVTKVASNGNLLWSKLYGDSSSHDKCRISAQTNGYIVTSVVHQLSGRKRAPYLLGGSQDVRILLLDNEGAPMVEKVVGGDTEEFFSVCLQASEKVFKVFGTSNSSRFFEGGSSNKHSAGEFYLSTLNLWPLGVCSNFRQDEEIILSVHPLPATDQVSIKWYGLNQTRIGTLSILSYDGRTVYRTSKKGSDTNMKIDVSGWAKGNYVMEYRSNEKVSMNKLILK